MPLVTVPGAQLHYEVHGTAGPWLVFAHGAAGNALSWWQQVPVFAPHRRCLLLDQRGWGRSRCDGLPDPARFGDDLLAVLDDAGAECAALIGQSMGGWAALDVALRAPARVTHLLLASTLAGLADEATLADLVAAHDGSRPAPALALAEEFVEREPAHAWLFERLAALNPPIEPAFLAALLALRFAPPPAPLPIPVRFVAGDRDRLLPLDLVRRAQSRLPGSELVVIPGAGHSVYWEKPAAFNATLASLLGLPPPQHLL